MFWNQLVFKMLSPLVRAEFFFGAKTFRISYDFLLYAGKPRTKCKTFFKNVFFNQFDEFVVFS